jgi:hypothetical protein
MLSGAVKRFAETARFLAALKCTLSVTLVESGEAALPALSLLWAVQQTPTLSRTA